MWKFREAIKQLPAETLRLHLTQGDFERWLCEVLHDQELARQLRKLRAVRWRVEALRGALFATVAARYEALESTI